MLRLFLLAARIRAQHRHMLLNRGETKAQGAAQIEEAITPAILLLNLGWITQRGADHDAAAGQSCGNLLHHVLHHLLC